MGFTQKDYDIIRQLSKTTYDLFITPPPLDSLAHILTSQPKNYATIDINTLSLGVIEKFSKHEPLISKLSEKNLLELDKRIRMAFHGINFMDIDEGGSGLIIPTFMEIMNSYIFWIRDYDCVSLVNNYDHQFYNKYFWCFDQYSILCYEQEVKTA